MNTRLRTATATALSAIAIAMWVPRGHAGPTVIRDEMLRDTAFTPVLGRGYSLATNTLQSICLSNVVKTKPSYNFDYKFQEMKEDGSVASSSSSSGSSRSTSGGFFTARRTVTATSRYDESTKTTWHKHRMMVTILIDIYYSSVDESQSKMSPAATSLLNGKDIPGFFDACGMYYIRSISRQAALISTFTYESSDTKRNTSFENSLQVDTRGFDSASASKSTSSASSGAMNLTIETYGVGLGKSESADLISYDVKTFKNAIKSAFQATQPDDVGMVTAIEITPWVENTEFQALNKLVPETVPVVDDKGFPVMDITDPANPKPKTKVVLPYAQKRMLTQNAEFLAEIDRAGRAKLNVFYKAKMCKAQIAIDNMKQKEDGTWKFQPIDPNDPETGDRGEISIVNNRAPSEFSTMRTLYELQLSDDKLQRIWMEYDAFMYGGTGPPMESVEKDPLERAKVARALLMAGNKNDAYPSNVFPGAEKCVSDLMTAGITVKSYRSVRNCQRIEETFATVSGQAIDDYCMPSEGKPLKKAGGSLNPLNP